LQVSINTLSETEREADIQLTHEEIQPFFDQAYEEFRPKVDIKGFRKGRVPLDMIKQRYGQALEYEALDKVASTFFGNVVREQKIDPIGRPSLSDYDFKRGEKFAFKVRFEVRPVIELKSYKGIDLVKYVHKVTDAEINEEIYRLRRINSTSEPADRVSGTDFAVTADVQETDETGAPLVGKKTPNVRFHLVDPDVAPEVKHALASAEPGGTYKATVVSQHGDHSHTSHLSLSVLKVEKVSLPPYDDDLASKASRGQFTSADAFKDHIGKEIRAYWEDLSTRRIEEDIASEIVKSNEFVVPASLIESLLDGMIEDMQSRQRDRKLPRDFDKEKFREENRSYAVWQAKWMLLKERIAEVETIAVTDQDIEEAAERDAQSMSLPKDRILAHYKSSESAKDRLHSKKIMSFIMNNAKLVERDEPAKID
jgi:trigger factor